MGKGGGAGKVYFVLYLAVVLELLIIIVERDEAEELLHKKQKDTMRIVESILSQLQSGAGTEGMNTRPQDEITIPPPGINVTEIFGTEIKAEREYIVEVGVTDISTEVRKRETESTKEYPERVKKLIKLANVEQIEYQIFFSNDKNVDEAPPFPDEKQMDKYDFFKMQPGEIITEESTGSIWKFLSSKEMRLDEKTTFDQVAKMVQNGTLHPDAITPVYPASLKRSNGPNYSPDKVPVDSIFSYSDKASKANLLKASADNVKKRAFLVNFKPPNEAGWYKIRFRSRTNRILGVRGDVKFAELKDDATVNIGTVQLSVKDLKNVYKELKRKLEKYSLPSIEVLAKKDFTVEQFDVKIKEAVGLANDEKNAIEIKGNIQLYGYIAKLLVPGLSSSFSQNRGSMEIDVHVTTPNPPDAPPTVYSPQYTATFDVVDAVFECSISPYKPGQNSYEGKVLDDNGNTVARVSYTPLHQIAGSRVTEPVKDSPLQLRALIDKKLSPGKYKVIMTHNLRGKTSTSETQLEVFKTGLTDQSDKDIRNKLNFTAYYGYSTTLSAVPLSGTKIKNDQFRIYLYTDNNQQKPYKEGLTIDKDDAFSYEPSAKQVTVRITWIQPLTGKEIDLFKEFTREIKQESSQIITSNVTNSFNGPTRKFKIVTSGIGVARPSTGVKDKDANVKVEVVSADIQEGLKEYAISMEPQLSGSVENGFEFEIELSGKPDPGKTKARGTIEVKLKVVAINPINGKASDPETVNINIPVNYEGVDTKKKNVR